ncbi:MAG: IS110 family transposase [Candidatus Dadabacteria bacterium]|nr:IS110 family transposase [Candidatus Dadabacteria bacterium]MXZ48403.1 IS110 family transposase [Candidatus Dadabacteria bacterium]MYB26355.1 IS110 family transposase [Candidatus Dadabacteria bacterium]
MKNHESLFFGVDWGRSSHQVCVVDHEGSVVGEKSFKHSGGGLLEMAQWMREISDSEACDIAAAIEVNHGPVVESLVEQGFGVYSINPKQLDRFRDRFCVSGAKDDRRDALVLASALRTDRSHFRLVEPRDPDVIILREFNRTREELTAERTRCVNRLRGLLFRYYPQFCELLGKKVNTWHLELWELMPCPDSAKRKRVQTVDNLLKRNAVRRFNAKQVLEILRRKKIELNDATTGSCIEHIRMIIERMRVIDRQLKETKDSIKQVIETMNSKLKAEGERPTDIEILRSIPGVGPVVLATLIAEAWDLVRRRDLKALRCLGGTAPVTRQSGKSRQVVRRRAVCRSLANAFHTPGGIAVKHDPVSRVKYEALRAKGHGYCRSVRTVCDRLLLVACAILKKGELFDKEFKKPLEDIAA